MRVKWLATFPCALLLTGCAKFPPPGTFVGYTRLTFSFTFNGPINPNYYYVVAIRVLTPPVNTTSATLSDPSQGPSPVVDTGSKNGVMQGLPTHYIIFNPQDVAGLYQVYRFPTKAEEGSSADPTDPAAIDLRWPGIYVRDVIPGSAVNPVNPDGSTGASMGFAIDTSYLNQNVAGFSANSQSAAAAIQNIQFNIFTMNYQALSAGQVQQRVMDAIGNQTNVGNSTFSNPIQVNIQTGGIITDQSSSVPEQANDTFSVNGSYLAGVDLTSWSINVSTP